MKSITPDIVAENKDFIIINKPAGLVVNRSVTTDRQYTIQDWLQQHLGSQVLPWSLRMGLVHRLDKDTSGLMVLTKTADSYYHFLKQFKSRQVKKEYLALVHGRLAVAEGTIHLPIKRDPRNRRKFTVYVGGKMAKTSYRTVGEYESPRQKIAFKKYYSLIRIGLITGRTHQIRVHFKHLNHPLVGDDLYSGHKTVRSDHGWCRSLFLQSVLLSFTGPDHKRHTFTLELNPFLRQSLSNYLIPIKNNGPT